MVSDVSEIDTLHAKFGIATNRIIMLALQCQKSSPIYPGGLDFY